MFIQKLKRKLNAKIKCHQPDIKYQSYSKHGKKIEHNFITIHES